MINVTPQRCLEGLDLDKVHTAFVLGEELKLENASIAYFNNDSFLNILFPSALSSFNSQSFIPACFIEVDTLEHKSRCAMSESKQTPIHITFKSRKLARSPPAFKTIEVIF